MDLFERMSVSALMIDDNSFSIISSALVSVNNSNQNLSYSYLLNFVLKLLS